MKEILDKMEEHIAAIRNIQRNFDYHSRRLENLMKTLSALGRENTTTSNAEILSLDENSQTNEPPQLNELK
jgi:hypothetical protein